MTDVLVSKSSFTIDADSVGGPARITAYPGEARTNLMSVYGETIVSSFFVRVSSDASREKLGLLMGGSTLEQKEAAHAAGA